jgi:TRAP-type C4-dicarboxylate transport system permease large subunit
MFLDPLSMVLITVPIVYPVVVSGLGFDPIWLAVIIVKMVELGSITPPVGLSLFTMRGVFPEASLRDITIGCLWFMLMDLVTMTILTFFPAIATWLPSKMGT